MMWCKFLVATYFVLLFEKSLGKEVFLEIDGASYEEMVNPNYPEAGPPNQDLTWQLKTKNGGKIAISCMEIIIVDKWNGKCSETDQISFTHAQGTEVICGGYPDGFQKIFDTNEVRMRLRIGSQGGAYVKCSAVAKSSIGPKVIKATVGLHSEAFVFQSPGYPEAAPVMTDVKWEITSAPATRISVQCDGQLMPDSGCPDKLTIEAGQEKKTYCEPGKQTFISKTNLMIVRYQTGNHPWGQLKCIAQAVVTGRTLNRYQEVESEEVDSSEHATVSGRRNTTCPCGWANREAERVVNGEVARPNELSFMAIILIDGRNAFCGGSILTRYHILTAAHCTKPLKHLNFKVGIGSHGIHDKEISQWESIHEPAAVVEHERYDPGDLTDDIALIVLKEPIKFNKFIGRTCLPTRLPPLNNKRVRAYGWGYTNVESPDYLMKTDLKVVDINTCGSRYAYEFNSDVPNRVCTFSKSRDICNGDSGGPLLWLDPGTNRYVQVGLMSKNKAGCQTDIPTVHTSIAHYRDWILRKVEETRREETCSAVL